ncbi:MAG: hypothetical protein NE330_13795 [Lentisphaeraceae bacterium]|nr:hypothetical protein [Lentisphaeraceae bacterium]
MKCIVTKNFKINGVAFSKETVVNFSATQELLYADFTKKATKEDIAKLKKK